LPQHAEEFIKAEGIELMIEILDHPNPDIFVESITTLSELIEEDILNENPELRQTVKIMVQNEVWNFLARIIVKLNDNDEEERKILFKAF